MTFASHRRAIDVSARYDVSCAAERRRRAAHAPAGFPGTFQRARPARARQPRAPTTANDAPDVNRNPSAVWPAAFALLLVANLAAPTSARVPARSRPPSADDGALRTEDPLGRPENVAPPDVAVAPLVLSTIKSEYTSLDLLKAMAVARNPFRSAARQLADAFAAVSGGDVDPELRRSMDEWAGLVDEVTGLLPRVQLMRIPAEVAGIAVDDIEGRPVSADRLTGLIQFTSPSMHANAQKDTVGKPEADFPVNGEVPPNDYASETFHDAAQVPLAGAKDAEDVEDADDDANGRAHERDLSPTLDHANEMRLSGDVDATPVQAHAGAEGTFAIRGEFDHLAGYEQTLAPEHAPADASARRFFANGHHYLRGAAGVYRIERGLSGDHWLIDAPRRNRAQVPVTFDPATQQWEAHAPLRVCGGGCGASKPAKPDSINGSFEDIFLATRHLPAPKVRGAILSSFADLGLMNLVRSNRADLRSIRDNSIVDHRMALREAMKHIDRHAPLARQQRLASEITTRYYFSHQGSEAFCQENAEILFQFLLEDGVPAEQLRMITVQPRHRAPHVMVLYSESRRLIDILDKVTPHPPVDFRPDGIGDTHFAWAVFLTRDKTVLLDPWSRSKAISFAGAGTQEDVVAILDAALADIGHRPGRRYVVTVTRPLSERRGPMSRQGSHGSLTSAGSSGGTSLGAGSASGLSLSGASSGSDSLSFRRLRARSSSGSSSGGESSGGGSGASMPSSRSGLPSLPSAPDADESADPDPLEGQRAAQRF
ncbi:hypothetical protein [Pandoraea pulmonicola]|uniref:Uncharacterized protein n=1 Tax=Pandoraea pulmonicola TaxID=93221 RepID=A0AAJ5D0J6_PANPU|nr:hypothetical protein [Pandoraea pulmonicola]APD13296.1 hypothetical protein RO07_25150 [Pandoraea pulmonicola]SUA90694.1 Uncharacterised protein [Pandoraea pulmonicola]